MTQPGLPARRRRRALRGWIPTAILLAIIAGFIAIALVVANQGIGKPPQGPPAVGPHGYSKFDAAGMRYISDTREVWIDVRSIPIAVSSIKMQAGSTVEIPPREGINNYLGLYGNGTAVKIAVDSISIRSSGDHVVLIVAREGAAVGFPGLQRQLDPATEYGISDAQITTFLDEARVLNRTGAAYSRTIGPGLRLGVPVTVHVSCDESATCQVEYRIDVSAH